MSHPIERRIIRGDLKIKRRAKGDGGARPRIVGHAARFDEWTTLYEGTYWVWREVVRPGAFANAIAEKQDVRCLLNHDPNFILGRTKAGTLRLKEDAVGLLSDADAPDTQTIRDLALSPIDRGDIDGMSFAFGVRRADKVVTSTEAGITVIDAGGERITIRREGDREIEERELLDLDLYDVSPVVYPAYEGTDVAMRSVGRDADFRRYIEERDTPRSREDLGAKVRSRLLKTLAAT